MSHVSRWCAVAMLVGSVVVGCGSSVHYITCDPRGCDPPPACLQVRDRPADHVCLNFRGRDAVTACETFNGVASGFGRSAEWQVLSADLLCDYPGDWVSPCSGPCTLYMHGPGGFATQVLQRDFIACPDPATTCHLPPACMWMVGGCFGPETGDGSIDVSDVAMCHETGTGQECTLRGTGTGLGCQVPWTFSDAVVDEDCMGAQLRTPPCEGAGAVSFRVTGEGLTLRRSNQPDVTLGRGGGSCAPPAQCMPTALEGCWVGSRNHYVQIDAPSAAGPGRWTVGGRGRALVCSGSWDFSGAEVDGDCMGVRLDLPCLPPDDRPAVFRLVTPDRASIQRASGANASDLERKPASECQ